MKMPMKKPQSQLIDDALFVLRDIELRNRRRGRTLSAGNHTETKSDAKSATVADLATFFGIDVADVRVVNEQETIQASIKALQEYRNGEVPDKAWQARRTRGSPPRSQLGLALKIDAWRSEGKTWDEIETLADKQKMGKSLDRLRKLHRQLQPEIKKFHQLKKLSAKSTIPQA